MRDAQLLGRLLLRFDREGKHVPEDLSAAVRTPEGHLWVAADEHGFLERLSPLEPRIYGDHARACVPELLALGDSGAEEIDLEAVDHADGALWLVGSHSAKRKKPKGKDVAQDLERLAQVEQEPSRFLLARMPLEDGQLTAADGAAGDGRSRSRAKKEAESSRRPARLVPAGDGESLLLELLQHDPHLGPFVARHPEHGGAGIPGKDNGFDVEGLAVLDGRVFLGLRGPVLRGYALLLSLELEPRPDGFLHPRERKGRTYRKHFLDLDGLGVRELCVRGDDLLVLAGPTMALEGPVRLFLLPGGARLGEDSLHAQEEGGLERVLEISQLADEKAEGVALHSWFEEDDSVLVVYDTPSPQRRYGETGVFADVFRVG